MIKGKYVKPFIEKIVLVSDCVLASGIGQYEGVGSFDRDWIGGSNDE